MINIQFTYIEIYLIVINVFSFLLYAFDKFKALDNSKNSRRISEKNLLFSSLLGGTVGSVISMFLFRHKIKKTSFLIKLFLVISLQIAYYLYFYFNQNIFATL